MVKKAGRSAGYLNQNLPKGPILVFMVIFAVIISLGILTQFPAGFFSQPSQGGVQSLPPQPAVSSFSTNEKNYVYGPQGLVSEVSGGGTVYYHSGRIGSVQGTSDSSGNQVFSSNYQPFGSSFSQRGFSTYQFAGKELDSSGLYYSGARYYDTYIGRFTQVDPLTKFANSPYIYAADNPLKYIDPDGREIRGGDYYEAMEGAGDTYLMQRTQFSSDRSWYHPEHLLAGVGNIGIMAQNALIATGFALDQPLAAAGMDETDRTAAWASLGLAGPGAIEGAATAASRGVSTVGRGAVATSRFLTGLPRRDVLSIPTTWQAIEQGVGDGMFRAPIMVTENPAEAHRIAAELIDPQRYINPENFRSMRETYATGSVVLEVERGRLPASSIPHGSPSIYLDQIPISALTPEGRNGISIFLEKRLGIPRNSEEMRTILGQR